jgi:hypothetical protein
MAQYVIKYLDGDTETVEADGLEHDPDARDYNFTKANGKGVVALAPAANVRSIHRHDDNSGATMYPHKDGDVTVLGPEVIASTDGETISWKGEHYTRRFYRFYPLGR